MKKVLKSRLLVMSLVLILVATLFVGCGSKSESSDTEKSTTETKSNDSGEKKSKEDVTVTWATIAGFYSDWMDEAAANFEAETGIKAEIIQIDFGVMYEKQGIEMASKTGAYDLVTVEPMWKAEWANAGYLTPLDDLIEKNGLSEDIKNFDPGTLALSCKYDGKIYTLPYYTYNMGRFARADLFEDPTEQAAFKAEYGYDLRVPETYDELWDTAEFFTRDAGETLKGEVLENPFYGVGLMAGRFPQIQDEWMSILWSNGGDVMDSDLNATCNSEIGVEAMQFYVDMLDNFAPPGARTSAYDEVVAQMQGNLIAQTAGFYQDQYPNMMKTEEAIPGAKMILTPPPKGTVAQRGYVGAFGVGLTSSSKHPEEAFQFLSFLMNYDTQMKFALGGGSPIRTDVMNDPEFKKPERRMAGGNLPILVDIMAIQKDLDYAIFNTPAAGKIYEEMMIHCNMAANHEVSCQEAMDMLAAKIDELNAPFKK
jgi:multiple sugar transport system substrate-binding protein